MNTTDFVIYDGTKTADIVMDSSYGEACISQRSYAQIYRAVGDLRQDIAMVTGSVSYNRVSSLFADNALLRSERLKAAEYDKTPQLKYFGDGIIVGSISHSKIINAMIADGKLPEAEEIRGKWEAFVIKQVDNSLVIAGSDARGTIYGIYCLSEKIGVSPWYWFSDAPVTVKNKITVNFTSAFKDLGPNVKYRGIFINDEECLISWAKLKFPTHKGTPDVNLYRHVFELMLRLRANTLWPAMHEGTTAFNMAKDDAGIPINAKEASLYGIIMASSHCEMMLRCNVSEWGEFKEKHKAEYIWNDDGSFDYTQNKDAILGYWKERLETNKNFESILALGIRGIHDGDAETDNLHLYKNSKAEMMKDVINEQRKLIKEVYGSETAVAQVFIPYKGMADIYNQGLRHHIPEDVMLMWAEDNYGNLRQTPTVFEASRSGGCGVYYHSSYWSWYSPKSYLWLNSCQMFYMAHQMQRAYDTGAKAYWILNVGDIKPGDMVTELFLNMAWDITAKDNIKNGFLVRHAMRDYGVDKATAKTIARVATEFYRLSGIKKAEFFGHENPSDVNNTYFSSDMLYPFSVTGEGDEGMRLVNKCNEMADTLTEIYSALSPEYRHVFYQQIYYHVLSYRDVAEEYVYLWKNNMCASEGRYSGAEIYAVLSQSARERIAARQKEFWAIKSNKWERVINYDHPVSYYNMNEGVLLVRDRCYKSCEIGEGLGYSAENAPLRFDSNAQNECFIDLFAKGKETEKWSLNAPGWVVLSKTEGETANEERVIVSVNFARLTTSQNCEIEIYNNNAKVGSVPVVATVTKIAPKEKTYVEANGKVVIESEHFTQSITGSDGSFWQVFENVGRHKNSMSALPFRAPCVKAPHIKDSAALCYRVYFTSQGTFKGCLYRTPSLNEGVNDDGSARTCNVAVGIDNSAPVILEGNSTTGGKWKDVIMHMVEPICFSINVPTPGWHDIYVYRVDAGIIFDRITIETIPDAIAPSLLGPEESPNGFSRKIRKVAQLKDGIS